MGVIRYQLCYDVGMCDVKIVIEGAVGEIIEKKSRFIATIRPVNDESEAVAFIEEMKKKYWDARHNCSAFVIGEHNELTRCSDDGEPSGTAGRPMLEVLLGAEVHNVAVVVTRYFGGVLLGTGGLVRAYQAAVKEGLAAARIAVQRKGMIYALTMDYNEWGRVQSYLAGNAYNIEGTDYSDKVFSKVIIPITDKEQAYKQLIELTNGKLRIDEIGECQYLSE